MTSKEQIAKILDRFTPEQQQLAKTIATMKVENKVLTTQVSDMKKAYDDLWKVMIVILHAQPGNELRIHETQFLRFKEEYRIDKQFDEGTKELVMTLKMLGERG